MNGIYDVLRRIENIENPKALHYLDQTTKIHHERHLCNCSSTFPHQTNSGRIFCIFCEDMDDAEINRNAFFDKRLHRKLRKIQIKCHLNGDGCEWIGFLFSYEQHIVFDCKFAKAKCSECFKVVHLTNMNEHKTRSECLNHKNVFGSCPLKCGHVCENWMMQSHVVEECPESRNSRSWRYECSCRRSEDGEHSRKCVEKNFEIVSTKINKSTRDSFELYFEHIEVGTVYRSKDVRLQNILTARVELTFNHNTQYLEVNVIIINNHKKEMFQKTLKETEIIVGLTNIDSRADKCADYKRVMSINATDMSCFTYFHEPKFIFLENILKNDKTGTCFHHNGTIHVTVNLQYPNKFGMSF